MSGKRIEVLDSLRGIASLQVVIYHCFCGLPFLLKNMFLPKDGSLPEKDAIFFINNSPLHFFWSGHYAVILFFVLSGFVLSIPFYKTEKPGYLSFFIKRIVRLYLPCAAIITLSVIGWYFLYNKAALSPYTDWLQDIWSRPMNEGYLKNVYLLNAYFHNVASVLWTLPIELQLSLVLPIFLVLISKMNKTRAVVFVAAYIVFYHCLVYFQIIKAYPFLHVFFYFTFFLMGAVLSRHKQDYVAQFDKLPNFIFYFLLFVSLMIYTSQVSFWWLPSSLQVLLKKVPDDYMACIAAILFIGFALSKRFCFILSSPVLIWLGKISFSLYLTHMVWIAAICCTISGYFSPYVTMLIAFLSCFPFAFIFYRLVELPSMKLAKTAGKIFQVNK